MRLRCPECSTAYSVDDQLITGTSPTFRCSRCEHVFVVETRAATHEEREAEAVIDTGRSGENFSETTATDPTSDQPREPASSADNGEQEALIDNLESADSTVTTARDATSFDPEDDFFVFPKDEVGIEKTETRTGGQISVLPFVSLFGILLFVFALVTMTYQVDPAPLEAVIRQIPWYGSTIFESRHFKRGLEVASLTSEFQAVLGQREVMIVSGTLVNRNPMEMQNVEIEAQVYDAEGKTLGKQTIYLGSAISSKIIQDMTPREISLLQSLKPQNVYRIAPNGSVNFTIVLPKPNAAVSAFSCRVLSAEAA